MNANLFGITMSNTNKLYPSPSIVLGIGKFGLASLEFLGEKWLSRQATGGDASLRNLRLIHADFDESKYLSSDWSHTEKRVSNFLAQVRSDDMPNQALDMLILRTMGLVRFYDGAYQVCAPRDGGFMSVIYENGIFRFPTDSEKINSEYESKNGDKTTKLYRRKFFDWLTLGTDPISAVQNLASLRLSNPKYDNFVGAILHRVKLGHSPQVILRMIFRAQQLCEFGSDPSPWSWITRLEKDYIKSSDPNFNSETTEEKSQSSQYVQSVEIGDKERYGDFLVQEITDEVRSFAKKNDIEPQGMNYHQAWGDFLSSKHIEKNEKGEVEKEPLRVPHCNLYRTEFYTEQHISLCSTPYSNMYMLLQQDFTNLDAEVIRLLPVPDFQLGMVDQDIWDRAPDYYAHLDNRLKEYGRLAYQGLVLLWSELEQAYSTSISARPNHSNSEELAQAVKQSLGFLGELLVKELLFDKAQSVLNKRKKGKRQPSDIWTDGLDLPNDASNQLYRAQITNYSGLEESTKDLFDRLIEIGVPLEENQELTRELYHRINFSPEQLDIHLQDLLAAQDRYASQQPKEDLTKLYHTSDKDHLENDSILKLRSRVNAELRHLYNLENLRHVNKGIHRTPPKLKIFVVADFHDPFARVALQPILKCVAAEVFRVVNNIFQIERGGVWSNTSIVPLLWVPNPTDPTAGSDLTRERRNRESAVSLHAVHSLRKWLESIPMHSCNIRQIFLNSRTTDNAYLGTREAVTQTAHFVEYQVTNTFVDSVDLDATQAFIGPNSLFASFACHLVDFPETRTREYLSTLLGLDFITHLRENQNMEENELGFSRGEEEEVEEPQDETSSQLEGIIFEGLDQESDSNRAKYNVRFPELDVSLSTIYNTLTDDYLGKMKGEVVQTWNGFVSDAGQLDSLIRSFHIHTQRKANEAHKKEFKKVNKRTYQYKK